jgi:hypothetical protein
MMVTAPPRQKPVSPTLAPFARQILRGAAHGLRGGVHEIERVHLFAGRIRVVIRHHRALVEVRRQRIEARHRKAVRTGP